MTHRDYEINGFTAANLIRWVGFFEISCWEDWVVSSQRDLGGPEGQFNRSCTHKWRYFSLCDHWKYWWPLTLWMNEGAALFGQRPSRLWKLWQRETICQAWDSLSNVRNGPGSEKHVVRHLGPCCPIKIWNEEGSVFVKTLFFWMLDLKMWRSCKPTDLTTMWAAASFKGPMLRRNDFTSVF